MIELPTSTRPMLLTGDVMAMLRTLPDESIDCAITSPPYLGLRSYKTEPQVWGGNPDCDHAWGEDIQITKTGGDNGIAPDYNQERKLSSSSFCSKCGAWKGELGLEPTPGLYVAHLVEIFREVRRVLRPDATLWLNLGDSYAGSGMGAANYPDSASEKQLSNAGSGTCKGRGGYVAPGLKPKDLVGIPWRVAFALQADGWWLRSDIIWSKPNPMPESVTDRPTKAHEYVFLLSKSKDYYYDNEAVKEQASYDGRKDEMFKGAIKSYDGVMPNGQPQTFAQRGHERWLKDENGIRIRNRRSVWTIATQSTSEAHFATYPEELVEICLKAGTSQRGACAKCGAPWERIVKRISGERNDNGRTHSLAEHRQGKAPPPEQGWESTTSTLGWRPTCTCYGLEIIEDQPIKPTHKKDESQTEYDNRFKEWEWELQNWRERWNILKPQYDAQSTIPCLVLDPFVGSGTTCKVAMALGRRSIGIDLNPAYIELAKHKCGIDLPALESFRGEA